MESHKNSQGCDECLKLSWNETGAMNIRFAGNDSATVRFLPSETVIAKAVRRTWVSYTDIFIRNVLEVASMNGIKIGDMEEASGVSVGYLSRVRKRERHSISLDTACRISDFLNVSVDEMTNADFLKKMRKIRLREAINDLEKELKQLEAENESI